MARGQAHSDSTRAAVIAALLQGQSVHEVAKAYSLSPRTVRQWRKNEGYEGADGQLAVPAPPQKAAKGGEAASAGGEAALAIEEVEAIRAATGRGDVQGLVEAYLGEILVTLRIQARQFAEPAWLARQPAADLAVLHGVVADKAFRILAALEDAGEPATDEPAA